ncbi:MAG: LysR family transcriptional regulator [Rhodospirillaceae bacterium]|jgi:DNA-binding transcriptional LysR family regulator|nr:LysR family transcriptional regulator [Rhodospirillaceae bacterium]MAX61859.1 LysR family transcriptional regulator [Rhodospirillaceae bacterium]|tara:strand:- start:8867 stop:9727 length:861 start_codon:yes stop_codon:yes gene_type:complete
MNWDDCRVFLSVARSGRMLTAARSLGSTQATVSRRIKALEESLDTILLVRRAHGCDLTDDGRLLFEKLERAEVEFLGAVERISNARHGVSGIVRIGAPDGFGTAVLAPRLPDLSAKHPNLSIQLVPMPRTFSLSQREADIAICVGRPTDGALVVRKLMDYSLSLYAAPAYLERSPQITSSADLSDHTLVSYVDDLIPTPSLDYISEFTSTWANRIEVASALGQQEIVRAAGGIGILHDFLVKQEMGLEKVLPDLSIERSYWIVVHENQRHSRRIRAVSDYIIEIAR